MKLKATDQIHISSVSSDTLAPGTEFSVSDDAGKELLKKRPDAVEYVGEDDPAPEPERKEDAKMETPLANKAEGAAPANKAIIGAKPQGDKPAKGAKAPKKGE